MTQARTQVQAEALARLVRSTCDRFRLDPDDVADRIVASILVDVTDRRGWSQAWDGFDADVQDEIVASWQEIVREQMTTTVILPPSETP